MAEPSPTAHEVTFLKHLGTFNPASFNTPHSVWLQRYLDAMPLRVEWGKVDREQVRAEAERLLKLERQKVSRKAA